MEKLHLSDDQMRTFFSDIFFGRPGEKVGVERTTNWKKDDQERRWGSKGRLGQNTSYIYVIIRIIIPSVVLEYIIYYNPNSYTLYIPCGTV